MDTRDADRFQRGAVLGPPVPVESLGAAHADLLQVPASREGMRRLAGLGKERHHGHRRAAGRVHHDGTAG